MKPIDIDAQHQVLVRGVSFWSSAAIDQRLAVVAGVSEVAIRGQEKCRQRAREKRRAILPRVVARDEEEGLVLDDRPADRAGKLAQRIGNVHRADRRERASA